MVREIVVKFLLDLGGVAGLIVGGGGGGGV